MTSVKFSTAAYTKMMLHATTNTTTQIHGILVGTSASNITDAIPVCHSPPTKPILDMALRLAQAYIADNDSGSSQIVGWYTANERSNDDTPSPPTWKIVQNIDPVNGILVIVTSNSFDSMLQRKCDQDGRGRGFEVFSMQDSEMPMSCSSVLVDGDWVEVANKVADACLSDGAFVYDFENQLDAGAKGLKKKSSVEWLKNPHVQQLL